MKLTKENIQFIDAYLIKSNVIYVDIRLEMTDHIATAVEEKMQLENLDFYVAFKNYMVLNKATILKNNREYVGFSWTEIKKYLLFIIQPVTLIFAVLLFLLYRYVDIYTYFSEDFTFSDLLFYLMLSIAVFQVCYYYVFLKKRFYSIEKSGTPLFIIYHLKMFILPSYKDGSNAIGLLVFYLIFAYLLYFINEIKTFNKHKFNIA